MRLRCAGPQLFVQLGSKPQLVALVSVLLTYCLSIGLTCNGRIVGAAEIHRYLCDVAEKHDLRKYMRLNCMIDAATWDEDRSLWVLQITRTVDGKTEKFQDECDVLLSGTGVLNDWKYPNVEGLWDYRGKLLHTASWDPSYDFKGKRIAVLGNGASAVQVVPELRKGGLCIISAVRCGWLTSGQMPRK